MKFAICQELFEGWTWERQCAFLAKTGYNGLEVAPFTLAAHPREVSPARRKELRATAADHGLEVIGLHWLLAKTEGYHLTSPDQAVRQRTADYLKQLVDLCADLGGTVMVHGSPIQRNLQPGVTRAAGYAYATEVFQSAMPHFAERGIYLCMEPLTPKETNFCNTCAEAAELIRGVAHPNFVLHQDVKAMLSEATPIPDLIREFASVTRHFHVNDSNLLGPGMGATDFHPIFDALLETRYSGWVSVEVFDYKPGAEFIAETSLKNMQGVLRDLGG